jgi:hypothetical protein
MTPSLNLAFAFVVATLCYPGLAILGAGGFAAFFSHPALVALAIITWFLSGAWFLSSGNASPGEREDRANRDALARAADVPVCALLGGSIGPVPA